MTLPLAPAVGSRATAAWADAVANSLAGGVTSVQMARTANIVVTTSTAAPVTGYDEGVVFTSGSVISANTTTGLFTVAAPGLYFWDATAFWDVTGSGAAAHFRSIYIWQNGAEPTHRNGKDEKSFPGGSLIKRTISSVGSLVMAAGDTLQAVVYQDSGITIGCGEFAFTLRALALS